MRGMASLLEVMIYLTEKSNIVLLLKSVILIMHLLLLIVPNNRYLKQVKKRLLMRM